LKQKKMQTAKNTPLALVSLTAENEVEAASNNIRVSPALPASRRGELGGGRGGGDGNAVAGHGGSDRGSGCDEDGR
jgi:hypothetical protein